MASAPIWASSQPLGRAPPSRIRSLLAVFYVATEARVRSSLGQQHCCQPEAVRNSRGEAEEVYTCNLAPSAKRNPWPLDTPGTHHCEEFAGRDLLRSLEISTRPDHAQRPPLPASARLLLVVLHCLNCDPILERNLLDVDFAGLLAQASLVLNSSPPMHARCFDQDNCPSCGRGDHPCISPAHPGVGRTRSPNEKSSAGNAQCIVSKGHHAMKRCNGACRGIQAGHSSSSGASSSS